MSKHRRVVRGSGFAGLIAASALLPGRAAFAQFQVRGGIVAQQPADTGDGSEPKEGVYVNDSLAAKDTLDKAEKMERLKEWNKSADYFQEVLEKYRDRVIPVKSDKDEKVTQYTSITNPVQEHLAKWPAEGLDVYRARYETPAATLIDGAKPGDADTLNKVYSLYFVTDAGKLAGIRLIDLYLERGEFLAAATVGDRLLRWHPNLLAEKAAVLYRTALAYHLAGDETAARARLDRLHKELPAERGVVRGKDVILGDSLEQEMRIAAPNAAIASADSWRMLGGGPDHSRIPAAAGRPGARIATIAMSKPVWPQLNAQQKQIAESQFKSLSEKGGTIGVMPVVDRGELFFQDGQRVYAVGLESGMPLAGWSQTYGGDGIYALQNILGSPRSRQLTLTLTDHAVLAIMGQPDHQLMMLGQTPQGEARLVSLDRETGKENWTTALSQLPEEAKGQRTLQLTGEPLVVGGNVLVIGRAGKQAQFEDCYVLSFDLATGKYRWSCYIASANVAGAMWGQPMMMSENTSHLAYANGRVFVQTNLGALAALDAYSGTIAWLNIYPTDVANIDPNQGGFNPFFQNQQMQTGTRRKPWSYNPVIVSDGKVFTLPTDGKYLLIYDAQSGAELKRIRVDDLREQDSNGCDTLLGVSGNELFVSGELDVICLDWQKYDLDAADKQAAWVWPQTLPRAIRGRGFITTDSVFVPAEDHLYRIDRGNGKVADVYPARPRVWDEGEEPGNVLVTSDHVILSGANSVEIYTDLTLARAKLDREVTDAPTDAEPRLKYAEVMFVAGQPDTALQKLDEAIQLLGGASGMQAGAARDHVFHDALSFAQKLSSDERPDVRDRAAKLYDRAGEAAGVPVQQVHYRLSRARFDEASAQPVQAVGLYQQILSDPQMRTVPLLDEATASPTQADAVAEKQIARLMKKDPAVYAPFEAAAAAALKQAEEDKQDVAARLLAVAQMYPNSTIASSAMLEAAEAFESAGHPRLAIQAVRQLYFKTPSDRPFKPRIIEAMARNYLTLPGMAEVAAAVLAQQANTNGDIKITKPLKLPDGRILQDVTFTRALEEVRKYSGQEAARTLPDFKLPLPPSATAPGVKRKWPHPFLPEDAQSVIPDVKSLVLPLHDFGRADRIVALSSANKLNIFAAGQTQPLATIDALTEEPKNSAWINGNLLVWGPDQVMLVKPDQSKAVWTLDLKHLQPIEVARVGEVVEQVRPNPNANVMIAPNGQVFLRPNGRGRPGLIQAMPMNPAPQPPKPAAGAAEQVIEVRPVGDRVLVTTSTGRLISLDLASGKTAWQTRLSERAIDRLCANEDFTVIKVSDDTTVKLAAMDTYTGQMLGSKTFIAQNGLVPVNLALSADGTLVYTLPDRLCLKNLYAPWPDASDREVQGPAGMPPFGGATQPDQLVIAEGRILALADNGTDKYVRVHSLETGNPIPLKIASPQGDQEVDRVLTAGKNWNVSLRVVGPHLYVVSPEGVISYNLDRPAETWTSVVPDTQLNVRDMFVGQQFLVLVDDQTPPANGGAPAQPVYGLRAFGLYPASATNPAQSGRLDFKVDLTDSAGIAGAWQAVDGGFYYLTSDQKLHMLRGAKDQEGK